MFEITCPICQRILTFEDLANKQILPCPVCGQQLRVLVDDPGVSASLVSESTTISETSPAPPAANSKWLIGACALAGLLLSGGMIGAWAILGHSGKAPNQESAAIKLRRTEPGRVAGSSKRNTPPSKSLPGDIADTGAGNKAADAGEGLGKGRLGLAGIVPSSGNVQRGQRPVDMEGMDMLALKGVLKDTKPATRIRAIQALAIMKENAKGAIPNILDLLKDSDSDVRREAMLALPQLRADWTPWTCRS